MSVEQLRWDGGTVSGAWHQPKQASQAYVMGHGAGYDMNARFLVDVAEGLAAGGVAVLRFNFPYTEAGRRTPDKQPMLEACFRAVAGIAASRYPRPWLGGKSMGGRIASHVAAGGFDAAGLVFLGYPLHPPGKPERIRDAHLSAIKVPMLFLQGTRDSFATPELLHQTVESLPSATLVEIEGGDHSFKVRGRPAAEVTAELVERTLTFINANG